MEFSHSRDQQVKLPKRSKLEKSSPKPIDDRHDRLVYKWEGIQVPAATNGNVGKFRADLKVRHGQRERCMSDCASRHTNAHRHAHPCTQVDFSLKVSKPEVTAEAVIKDSKGDYGSVGARYRANQVRRTVPTSSSPCRLPTFFEHAAASDSSPCSSALTEVKLHGQAAASRSPFSSVRKPDPPFSLPHWYMPCSLVYDLRP
jgi:hypothetical protein